MYLPSAKTLFLGSFTTTNIFRAVGSRNVHRWIEVLRQVEGWDVDTYVPGHGAPGSKKDLADFRKFLEWLVAQVEMRLKQGQTARGVQKTLWLPKIYNWHAPDLAADTVADVCRQLAPQPTAPAHAQLSPSRIALNPHGHAERGGVADALTECGRNHLARARRQFQRLALDHAARGLREANRPGAWPGRQ